MKKQQIKAYKSINETRKPEISPIIGDVPEWLKGRILRSCPAKFDFPKFKLNHAYDGYMMICKFEVRGGKNGKVAYTSRFFQSDAFKKSEIEQKPIYPEFGTRSAGADSSKSVVFQALSSIAPEPTDNCQFICYSGICRNPTITSDTGLIYELDMKTLLPLSTRNPYKDFGIHAGSSHLMTDPETGETYNIGLHLIPTAKWKIFKFPPGRSRPLKDTIKKVETVAVHSCRNKTRIAWLHSFGMSQNYLIWIDHPMSFDATKYLTSIFTPVCPRELMEWAPEKKNYFNKRTRMINTTEILSKDAFVFIHILNCYEDKEHLIVDLCSFPDYQFVDSLTLNKLRAGKIVKEQDAPSLHRYVIPLCIEDLKRLPQNTNLVKIQTTATAQRVENKVILTPEVLSEIKMDYITMNKRFAGICHRYVWAGAFAPSKHHNRVTKLDLKTRQTIFWMAEKHQHVGEPVFIRRPGSEEEDDGVIAIVVINYLEAKDEHNSLVLLDAKDLRELGRANFLSEIPIAQHSIWC